MTKNKRFTVDEKWQKIKCLGSEKMEKIIGPQSVKIGKKSKVCNQNKMAKNQRFTFKKNGK